MKKGEPWSISQIISVIALGLFAVVVAALNFLMLLGDVRLRETDEAGLILGSTFAQASLAATYLAWGPHRLTIRLVLSTTCIITVGLCIAASAEVETLVILFALLPAGICVANVVPMAAMRLVYGVRLATPLAAVGVEGEAKYQFGIKQLLVATAAVAVATSSSRLAITRLRDEFSTMSDDLPGVLAVIAAMLIFSIVTSLLTSLCCLAARSLLWSLAVVAICAAIAHLEWLTYTWIEGWSGDDVWQVFYGLQAVQLVGIAWPLLALRGWGVQLVQSRR